jgi:hypothetical protein
MTETERAAWLAGLKVGDKVLIGTNSIGIIEKITPKRFFVVNGCRYGVDGVHRNDYEHNSVLHPWNLEDEKRINQRNIYIGYIKEVEKVNWRKIKFSKLERIVKILKEE